MSKKIDETKKLIRDFEAKKAAELADIDSVLKELKEKLEDAKLHKKLAVSSCNISEYKSAKVEEEDLSTQIEMYEIRRKSLEAGPLITEEEYTASIEGVRDEVATSAKKYAEKLKSLYDEIGETGRELIQFVEDADNTLQALQRDIYMNGDRGKKMNGRYEKTKVFSAINAVYEIGYEAIMKGEDTSKTMAAQFLASDYHGDISKQGYKTSYDA